MTPIEISGEIKPDCEDMFGLIPGTLSKVKAQLAAGPAPYAIHINSPGGSFTEALATANLLRDYECEVFIDAACYSAATLFLTIGSKVTMRPGSMLMFHGPSCEAEGGIEELTNAVAYLENIKLSAAALYASKTGKTQEEMLALMDGETWMTAEKAVEMGFADVAEGAPVEAVAFSRYTAGMKVSDSAPASVRLVADPVAYVAKLFGTEANADAIAERVAYFKGQETATAEMRVKVEETANRLLAETEAHKATSASLKAAQDAVLRFEERVARRVAELAAAAHVEPIEVKQSKPNPDSPQGIYDKYRSITDANERFAYFRANQTTLMRFLGN